MKKIIASGLILMCGILPLKAQIYTPGGTIQGTSSSNNVGIGTAAPSAKLNIEGGHGDSRFLLHANGNGNPDAYQADLSLWASEPGLTWSGVGIGNNIHNFKTADGGLTLLNTARGGSYIRLLDNAMLFNVVSVSGVDKQSLSINGNGSVGIGTINPLAKFDVRGTSASIESTIQIVGNGVSSLLLGQNIDGGVIRGQGGNNALSFWTGGSGDLAASGSGTEKMRINSSGNIGVGTTNPNSKLTIRSAMTGVSIHPGGNPYFGTLAFNRESGTGEIFDVNGQAFQINNGGNDKNLHFQVYNGDGSLVTNEALVINGINGNIGIGTTNPTSKLTVAGNINSREVKVTVDAGADFVFEKEYHLPSLTSLDTYIKENKHLPQIASAKEMQANGINLSEMNIKLLQKMEEMTLYIIQQDKEIKAQAKEITAFKNVFERLSKIEEKLETKQ